MPSLSQTLIIKIIFRIPCKFLGFVRILIVRVRNPARKRKREPVQCSIKLTASLPNSKPHILVRQQWSKAAPSHSQDWVVMTWDSFSTVTPTIFGTFAKLHAVGRFRVVAPSRKLSPNSFRTWSGMGEFQPFASWFLRSKKFPENSGASNSRRFV